MADVTEKDQEKTPEKVSKNAAKKAEKTAKKAEIIAEKKTAAGDASAEVEKEEVKAKYGNTALIQSKEKVDRSFTKVKELTASLGDQKVWIRGQVTFSLGNDHLIFFVLRQQQYTVQALLTAGDKVSKKMVEFGAGISSEAIVDVKGVIRKVNRKIANCSQQDIEIHVKQIFVIGSTKTGLPLLIGDATRSEKAEDASQGGKGEIVATKASVTSRRVKLLSVGPALFVPGDVLSFSSCKEVIGQYGNDGCSYKKPINDEEFLEYCQRRADTEKGWDLGMYSRENMTIGFVSQRRYDDAPVPCELISDIPAADPGTFCDGKVLNAVRELLHLKEELSTLQQKDFWNDQKTRLATHNLEAAFQERGWSSGVATSRNRNKVLDAIVLALNTTRQTLNKKLEFTFCEVL